MASPVDGEHPVGTRFAQNVHRQVGARRQPLTPAILGTDALADRAGHCVAERDERERIPGAVVGAGRVVEAIPRAPQRRLGFIVVPRRVPERRAALDVLPEVERDLVRLEVFGDRIAKRRAFEGRLHAVGGLDVGEREALTLRSEHGERHEADRCTRVAQCRGDL